MKDKVKVIAFDADDTLWENEPYFRKSEDQFAEMMSDYMPPHDVNRALLKTEIDNLPTFGYGVKSFVISMIETAMKLSDGTISGKMVEKIIEIGRNQLNQPVFVLDGVEKVLKALQNKYKLVMATKGDLMEQEGKLEKSGLEQYFHHIEVLSEKKKSNYDKLIAHLDVRPEEFLMIGNSVRSDILPVLELGGNAIHVPFHTTWEYEKAEVNLDHASFHALEHIEQVLELVG